MRNPRPPLLPLCTVLFAQLLGVLPTGGTGTLHAQDAGGGLAPGGISRFVSDRWGMARGSFTNRTDRPVRLSAVAIPPNSNGLEYQRTVEIPAHSQRTVQWPLRMPQTQIDEVEYLVFAAGGDDNVQSRRKKGGKLPRFPARLKSTGDGYTGLMASGSERPQDDDDFNQLLTAMLRDAKREQIILPVKPGNIGGFSHALDGLDQLCITSNELTDHPETCDAIRIWVQRGGNLLLALDQTGIDVAHALLADALPLSVVDTTSANSVTLNLNPDYSEMRFPVREVERTFPEPISWVRVVADSGEVIWSIDGWPAAIATNYGRGRILVTTIAPAAFINKAADETALIASSAEFVDKLFKAKAAPLITRNQAIATASQQVGYSIPSRNFATVVVLGFPILLLACGAWLLRRGRGELLLWVVPIAALIACVPAAVMGWSSRSVAPQTVIQQQVVRAIDGETELVSDGFTTVYTPNSGELAIEATDQSIFFPQPDASNFDYRRLIWKSESESEWRNMKPPVGIRTGEIREVLSLETPLRATATFSELGLVGNLQTGSFTNPTDAILSDMSPDRQSVKIETTQWNSSPENILAPNEYFTSTLLTQDQLRKAEVFDAMFASERGAAPNQLSMLYWAQAETSSLHIGDQETRRDSSVLVVQPVTLTPPEIGQQITIPPVALPYRSVSDEEGNVGTAYNNGQRTWIQRERGGQINLEFQVPPVCTPFDVTSAELQIKLTAGSRIVTVTGGDSMEVVETFISPAKTVKVRLPLTQVARDGMVRVKLVVSEPNIQREEGVADVDQDDAWKIDRVFLTLKGARKAE